MAVEIASAYVSLIPSFSGGAAVIARELGGPSQAAGVTAGRRFGSGFSKSFKPLAASLAGIFAAQKVGAFFTDAIREASGLSETVSKTNVVFGGFSKTVLRFGDTAARALGQSRQQALEAASTFGNLFVSMGVGQSAAASMSTGLVTLASDLASFNNVSPEEALEALRSGLVGEVEPLRRFGVAINAASVEQKALALGLATTKAELTEADKAQARYALIMEQTTTAQGDFARTSGGLANQQRILSAQWVDMKARVGRGLLPVVTGLVTFMNDRMIPALGMVASFVRNHIVPIVRDFGAAAGSFLLPILRVFGALLSTVIVPAVAALAKGLQAVSSWLGPIVVGAGAAYTAFKLYGLTLAGLRAIQLGWISLQLAGMAATGGLTVAVVALRAAMGALRTAMLAHPFGVVLLALTGLVAGLIWAWKNSETFRRIVTGAWKNIQAIVGAVWRFIYGFVITPFVKAMKWLLSGAVAMKNGLVSTLGVVRSAFSGAWRFVYGQAISPFVRGLQWLWNKAVAVKTGIVSSFGVLRSALASAWRWIRGNALNPLIRGFQNVLSRAIAVKNGIVTAFGIIGSSIGKAFKGVIKGIRGALNTVFGWINKWMIRPLNAVLRPFDLKIPDLPRLHSGGLVPGKGEKPYMLLGGEAVLNPKATRALGPDAVDALNRGEGFGGLGWPDWASWDNIKQGLAIGADAVTSTLGKGLKFAIERLLNPALARIGDVIPGPAFVEKPVVGSMNKFSKAVIDWATGNDSKLRPSKALGAPFFQGQMAFPLPRGSYRVGVGLGGYPGHTGQDFPAAVGTPVYSPFSGYFTGVNLGNRSYGRYANVVAGPLRFIGAHLSALVGMNRAVKAGDLIGRVGSTGNSTGPHLHAEFRRNGQAVNPRKYLQFDSGYGVLPTGHSLVYNGTGGPEPLVDPRRLSRDVNLVLHGTGSYADRVLLEWLRRAVRVEGGGNVQVALGR